jgi:hypothetical protein
VGGRVANGRRLKPSSGKLNSYHEEMNSNVFDGWFQTILTLVELKSVVLMDNSIALQSPGRMFTYNNLAKSEHLKLAIRKENQF